MFLKLIGEKQRMKLTYYRNVEVRRLFWNYQKTVRRIMLNPRITGTDFFSQFWKIQVFSTWIENPGKSTDSFLKSWDNLLSVKKLDSEYTQTDQSSNKAQNSEDADSSLQ